MQQTGTAIGNEPFHPQSDVKLLDSLEAGDLTSWADSEGRAAIQRMVDAETWASSMEDPAGYHAAMAALYAIEQGYDPAFLREMAEALRRFALELGREA